MAAVPVFTTLSPINLMTLAAVHSPGPELAVVGLLIGLELFSRRAFCRALCPLGALHSLAGRWGRLRVRVGQGCLGQARCGRCTPECPVGICVLEHHVERDQANVADGECTRCGACADVCPAGVLRLGLRDRIDAPALPT